MVNSPTPKTVPLVLTHSQMFCPNKSSELQSTGTKKTLCLVLVRAEASLLGRHHGGMILPGGLRYQTASLEIRGGFQGIPGGFQGVAGGFRGFQGISDEVPESFRRFRENSGDTGFLKKKDPGKNRKCWNLPNNKFGENPKNGDMNFPKTAECFGVSPQVLEGFRRFRVVGDATWAYYFVSLSNHKAVPSKNGPGTRKS